MANTQSTQRRTTPETNPISAGYHNAIPEATTHEPPSYEGSELPPARFKVLPREEEGRETLPQYSCTIHHEAVLERKMELRTPFDRAHRRNWKKVYLVLKGTKLEIHKPKKVPFAKGSLKGDNSMPIGYIPGTLLESYTLQLAQVGAATDYKKRHFVIRLRVQTQQFLLSCRTLEIFLDWLELLSAAVDLAPPLEQRTLPRYQTLPRRRRRAQPPQTTLTATTTASAFTPEIIAAQQEIMRQQFPHLLSDPGAANRDSDRDRDAIEPIVSITPTRSSRSTAPVEFVPEGAKWSPRRGLTREANLRLARRCVAELMADAPRISDFVVMDGKRYKILWEQRRIVPEDGEWADVLMGGCSGTKGVKKGLGATGVMEPPGYAEVFGGLSMEAGGRRRR
ncbi:hypothetical protein FPQ18DRAFT_250804 [Pyronema domesticum]|nr:hypothetical protein FPQ18DRAFT_250804 [Pyronema domesticum]